jgi:hypothetical protein
MQMQRMLFGRRTHTTLLIALTTFGTARIVSSHARDRRVFERPRHESSQGAAVADAAVISGTTIDAVTGAPVANTLIGLSQRVGSGPNTQPSAANVPLVLVLTDGQGRFVVRDVPKGSFLLLATAPGYIVSNFGQGRPGGPTRTIDLAGDERLTGLTIPLWRHAAISGTVTDEAGEPVVGATVRVLRRVANGSEGESRYAPGTETATDDRGHYRLSALTPGEFLVAVPQTQVTVPAEVVDTFLQSVAGRGGATTGGRLLDLMNSGSAVPSAGGGVRVDDMLLQSSGSGRLVTNPPSTRGGALFVYPTVFYAPSDSTSGSGAITVLAGQERSGVDFHLSPVRTVRVSGTVIVDGRPAPNVGVRLLRVGGPALQHDSDFEAAASVTATDGTFALLGMAPGQYVLKVLRTPRLTLAPGLASNPAIVAAYGGAPQVPGPALPLVGAQALITVGDSDVRDVVIPLRPGASVTGQVVFAESSTPPTTQQVQAMGVLLSSEDGDTPGLGLQIARVSAAGTFTITAPAPGRYLVTALAAPVGWRPSGLRVDGQPLTKPIDLGGDDVAGVSLTFTDKAAQVAGTVRTASGAPSASADIVVFPAERNAWIQGSQNPRQPRIEQVPNTGAFTIVGLLPGEYFVAAVADADTPDIVDPAFLETVSKFATRLTLGAGEKKNQDVTIGRIK